MNVPDRSMSLAGILVFFLLIGPAVSACGRKDAAPGETAPRGGGARPNVVILTLDTLRADHVACYGAQDVETPALDRLAAEGVQFMHAVTAVPLTLPSHASIFTGTYPPTHGVVDNVGFALPEEEDTLAERFRAAGWQTAAFVSAYVLNRCFGVSQGFDHYDDDIPMDSNGPMSPDSIQRAGGETMDRVLGWLEKHKEGPFFLWIHLFDPHSPYTPPEPYASRYPYSPYNGEVAYTDTQVGRFLQALEAAGVAGRTVIAVLGDHGEGLGEHKENFHGFFLYESTLRVPFILRAPGFVPRRVETQVRTIDVAPTLLELAGLEVPDHMEGRSLVSLMEGAAGGRTPPAYGETVFPRFHFGWSDLACVRTDRYKYVSAPKPELYDLEEDPGEKRNLVAEKPGVVKKMALLLDRIRDEARGRARAGNRTLEVDAEGAEALRLLGYTGTVSPRGQGSRQGALPDPKDKADLLLQTSKAEHLLVRRDYAGAIAVLRPVVKEEPGMVDARIALGVALLENGQAEEAVRVLRESTRYAPKLFLVWGNLGLALHRLGREGEAFQAFKQAYALNPSNLVSMGQMIDACFRTGRFRKGVKLCREYLKRMPGFLPVKTALAMGLVNMEKYDEARAVLEELLAADPEAPNGNYLLGKVLEAQGKDLAAVAAYEKENTLHGSNPDVWCSLAGLFGKLGKNEREMNTLEEAVRRFPEDGAVQLMLAEACAKRGFKDRALEAARRAAALNPASTRARELIRILER